MVSIDRNGNKIKVDLLSQNDEVGGKKISEWIADWWNWSISSRIDLNQTDDVYFLKILPKPNESTSEYRAEYTSSAVVLERQAILFPVLNTMIDDGTFPTEDTHTKRITMARNENNASPINLLSVTIDGQEILPKSDLNKIRMSTAEFELEAINPPLVNLDFPIPTGRVLRAASDGYFACIKGLKADKNPYYLRIRAQGVGGYVVNILYLLYVASKEGIQFDLQLKPKVDKMIRKNIITFAQAKKQFPEIF